MMEEEVKLNLDVGAYEARAWARRAGCILSLVDPNHAFFLVSSITHVFHDQEDRHQH